MIDWMPTTVTHELIAQLVLPEDGSVPLPVVFHYDTTDPFAVHATFCTGMGDGVAWVFARDLLNTGAHRPSGEGDVHVWPSWSPGRDVVFIGLASPNGEAIMQAPAVEVHDFLEHSYSLCPHGAELAFVDVDAAIETLLAR